MYPGAWIEFLRDPRPFQFQTMATVHIVPVVGIPDHGYRIHRIPLGDSALHAGQTCCWCFPLELEPGVFTHNAKDCREAMERQGIPSGRVWTLVCEYVAT